MPRRVRRLAAVLAAFCLIGAVAAGVQALEAGLLAQVNALRAESGLRPLRWSPALSRAAQAHCIDMAQAGYFGHLSSDGTPFTQRIARLYRPRRPQVWAVGENLLWSTRGLGPQSALRRWLESPEHRANLLDPRWREVGIAAARVVGAPGVFAGRSVVVLTVDFGVR